MVGHWSVSKQMTSRRFSIENNGNLIFVEHVPAQCNNEEQLPVGAYAFLKGSGHGYRCWQQHWLYNGGGLEGRPKCSVVKH